MSKKSEAESMDPNDKDCLLSVESDLDSPEQSLLLSDINDVSQRRASCFHEAAHAVFVYHAGLTILFVTVNDEEEICLFNRPKHPGGRHARELACVALAGLYTEWQAMQGEPMQHTPFEDFRFEVDLAEEGCPEDDSPGDEYEALRWLKEVANDPYTGELEACYQAACEEVVENIERWWNQIDVVAEKLYEVGHLEGDECAKLIESATPQEWGR